MLGVASPTILRVTRTVPSCISSGIWDELPIYRACDFAMAAVDEQLVLIGGEEAGQIIGVLGVWNPDARKWIHPYPDLPTARSRCSAVIHDFWLVVAGGWSVSGGLLCSVDVLNTRRAQWASAPPAPMPWALMKTAVVKEECYFLGGLIEEQYKYTDEVFSVSLPTLLSHLGPARSEQSSTQIWKAVPHLPTSLSAPVSILGALLALGGCKDGVEVGTIHLYQPDVRECVDVGELPNPRYGCAGAAIAPNHLVILVNTI